MTTFNGTRKGANFAQFCESVSIANDKDGDCASVAKWLQEKHGVTITADSVYQRIAAENKKLKDLHEAGKLPQLMQLPKLKKDKNNSRGANPDEVAAVFSSFFGQPASQEQAAGGAVANEVAEESAEE